MALCANLSQFKTGAVFAVSRHVSSVTSGRSTACVIHKSSLFVSGSRSSAKLTPVARRRNAFVTCAEINVSSTSIDQPGKEIVPDNEISITKTSFGSIGLVVGTFLLSFGFGAYFNLLPGTDFSAIMLTYGFPLALIGFALKYAELKPVSCLSYADAVALRGKESTPILVQAPSLSIGNLIGGGLRQEVVPLQRVEVRSDVTRFRYGDEQHLEEALKRIFRYGQSGGISRRIAPQLESIAEEVYDGRYSLVLLFEAPKLTLQDFSSREAKFTSFFGPGVEAIVGETAPGKYNVRLVSNGEVQSA